MASEGASGSKKAHNGWLLFRSEFMATIADPDMTAKQKRDAASNAWKALAAEEKMRYTEEVKKRRAQKGEEEKKKHVPSFLTRVSLKGLRKLLHFVNNNEDLRERVERMGFGRLLKVGLKRLPRDLIVTMLRSYDPPTHQFTIRGKSEEIGAEDVEQLLGIRHGGEEVKTKVDESDATYQELRNEYRKVSFSKILNDIVSGEEDHRFEFLFVLYTLGTFLCPNSSSEVSEKLVRVMRCTMDDFGKYDWATYIIKDLWKEMGDYVKGYRRGNEGQGRSTVGGCIYLLLLFFGENFNLNTPVGRESTTAIEYWTDEKIKELASKERKSVRGIMYGGKGSEAVTGKEERIIVEFLDPVCGIIGKLKFLFRNLNLLSAIVLLSFPILKF